MTASARGTVDKPGNNVKQNAGLNRAILDTAPGSFVNVRCVKAEQAGCQVILLDTRRYRSSQTCPSCARVGKKALSERGHQCGSGFAAARDQAAALSMLADGLKLLGREPASAARLETPSRSPKRPWMAVVDQVDNLLEPRLIIDRLAINEQPLDGGAP